MTARECARLQSMHGISQLPEPPASAFRALGNAVNVELVRKVAAALIQRDSHLRFARPDLLSAEVGHVLAPSAVVGMCQ